MPMRMSFGFDIDQFGADPRPDIPFDDREQLRHLLGPRRPGRAAGHGVGVQRSGAVDFAPFQIVGKGSGRQRARIEDVAAAPTASTGSGCGVRATHPRTAATPVSARAADGVRSSQSPPNTSATCSLMMPPVPVTNAVSQSRTCAAAGAAHELARPVDHVVHTTGHAGLPVGQLTAGGVEREVAAVGQVMLGQPRHACALAAEPGIFQASSAR